ncbi:hypothetical protein WA158_000135 [Blastocystis sp. Blastoise]
MIVSHKKLKKLKKDCLLGQPQKFNQQSCCYFCLTRSKRDSSRLNNLHINSNKINKIDINGSAINNMNKDKNNKETDESNLSLKDNSISINNNNIHSNKHRKESNVSNSSSSSSLFSSQDKNTNNSKDISNNKNHSSMNNRNHSIDYSNINNIQEEEKERKEESIPEEKEQKEEKIEKHKEKETREERKEEDDDEEEEEIKEREEEEEKEDNDNDDDTTSIITDTDRVSNPIIRGRGRGRGKLRSHGRGRGRGSFYHYDDSDNQSENENDETFEIDNDKNDKKENYHSISRHNYDSTYNIDGNDLDKYKRKGINMKLKKNKRRNNDDDSSDDYVKHRRNSISKESLKRKSKDSIKSSTINNSIKNNSIHINKPLSSIDGKTLLDLERSTHKNSRLFEEYHSMDLSNETNNNNTNDNHKDNHKYNNNNSNIIIIINNNITTATTTTTTTTTNIENIPNNTPYKEIWHIGQIIRTYNKDESMTNIDKQNIIQIYDLIDNKLCQIPINNVTIFTSKREHLSVYYTLSVENTEHINEELELVPKIIQKSQEPFSSISEKLIRSNKEWLYTSIYIYIYINKYPFGDWEKGYVTCFNANTGKHYVKFYKEEIKSGWYLLNDRDVIRWKTIYNLLTSSSPLTQYHSQELIKILPQDSTYCICCLSNISTLTNPLLQCSKCNLYIHLECDPDSKHNYNEEKHKYYCFCCRVCNGCNLYITKHNIWNYIVINEKQIICCDKCLLLYNTNHYCSICRKTYINTKDMLLCQECGMYIHESCESKCVRRYMNKERENRHHHQQEEEDTIIEGEIEGEGEIEDKDGNDTLSIRTGNSKKENSISTSKSFYDNYLCSRCRRKKMIDLHKELLRIDIKHLFTKQVEENFAPDYYKVISKSNAMCLDIMNEKIKQKEYASIQLFYNDFELICLNSYKYNNPEDNIWNATDDFYKEGKQIFIQLCHNITSGIYEKEIINIQNKRLEQINGPSASLTAQTNSHIASERQHQLEKVKDEIGKLAPKTLLPYIEPLDITKVSIQDKYKSILCRDMCIICGSTGDIDKMLFCIDCGECYHANCLVPRIVINDLLRTTWRCKYCCICEHCGLNIHTQSNNTIPNINNNHNIEDMNDNNHNVNNNNNNVNNNNMHIYPSEMNKSISNHYKSSSLQSSSSTPLSSPSNHSINNTNNANNTNNNNILLEDQDIISCDYCKKTYHMKCLNPPLLQLPKDTWYCYTCYHCNQCHQQNLPFSYSIKRNYCTNCALNEPLFKICPICNKEWNENDQNMYLCEKCERWVHKSCTELSSEDINTDISNNSNYNTDANNNNTNIDNSNVNTNNNMNDSNSNTNNTMNGISLNSKASMISTNLFDQPINSPYLSILANHNSPTISQPISTTLYTSPTTSPYPLSPYIYQQPVSFTIPDNDTKDMDSTLRTCIKSIQGYRSMVLEKENNFKSKDEFIKNLLNSRVYEMAQIILKANSILLYITSLSVPQSIIDEKKQERIFTFKNKYLAQQLYFRAQRYIASKLAYSSIHFTSGPSPSTIMNIPEICNNLPHIDVKSYINTPYPLVDSDLITSLSDYYNYDLISLYSDTISASSFLWAIYNIFPIYFDPKEPFSKFHLLLISTPLVHLHYLQKQHIGNQNDLEDLKHKLIESLTNPNITMLPDPSICTKQFSYNDLSTPFLSFSFYNNNNINIDNNNINIGNNNNINIGNNLLEKDNVSQEEKMDIKEKEDDKDNKDNIDDINHKDNINDNKDENDNNNNNEIEASDKKEEEVKVEENTIYTIYTNNNEINKESTNISIEETQVMNKTNEFISTLLLLMLLLSLLLLIYLISNTIYAYGIVHLYLISMRVL